MNTFEHPLDATRNQDSNRIEPLAQKKMHENAQAVLSTEAFQMVAFTSQ